MVNICNRGNAFQNFIKLYNHLFVCLYKEQPFAENNPFIKGIGKGLIGGQGVFLGLLQNHHI
jgi:hypothetical protein